MQDTSYSNLQQATALQPKRRSNRILFSLLVAFVGGFLGGVLTSYGPTFLNVHLTQPVLSADHVSSIDEESRQSEKSVDSTRVFDSAPASGEATALAAKGDARLVIHAHGRSYLLVEDLASANMGIGDIERVRGSDDFITTLRQKVRESKIPATYQDYRDHHFALNDAQGFSCTASTGPLMLLQQIATDFEGVDDEQQGWDEYGGAPMLVAELITIRGTCKDAIWARDVNLPPADIGRITLANKSLRRTARAVFRASKTYNDQQTLFEFQQGTGRWDANAHTTFTSISSAAEDLVLVSVQVGGCGEFEAQEGIVFRVQPDGALDAIALHKGLILQVDAAADIDGDGDLDLMTTGDGFDRSLVRQGDELTVEAHSAVSIQYCRC